MTIVYGFMILALLFASGSMLGWTLEVFYRRFKPTNKERVWINPGFLNGPCLPLYGFGLTALYLMAMLEKFIPIDNDSVRKGVLFAVMAVAMTVIELIALVNIGPIVKRAFVFSSACVCGGGSIFKVSFSITVLNLGLLLK